MQLHPLKTLLIGLWLYPSHLPAQAVGQPPGEVTVRLLDGLDSTAWRFGLYARAMVVHSANPAIAPGAACRVILLRQASGLFSLHLFTEAGPGRPGHLLGSNPTLSPSSANGAPPEAILAAGPGPRVLVPATTELQFLPRGVMPPIPAAPVMDFPPAAPGYPPLHASRPPDKGCHWTPFVSEKFGFELLSERCGHGENDWKPGETATGIGTSLEGPPQTAFDVFTKPAAQPVETAMRQQVVLKFKDPVARANCRVVRSQTEEMPGWQEYGVEPVGAYAHPKVTKGEEDEMDGSGLCNGMWGADVSTYFVYNPSLSKTHFFLFYGLADPLQGQPYDIFSLQFRQANNQ